MIIKPKRLYVGIDVHSRSHTAAIMHSKYFKTHDNFWRSAKMIRITNTAQDFDRLDKLIRSEIQDVHEVDVIVDCTGVHYSEPLIYFLQQRGYNVCYLESRATKAVRQKILDQENKSDIIDPIVFAFLRYLNDLHNISFRVSTIIPDLTSKATALRSLVTHRQQYNKLRVQATNRLHQYLLAVFPEAESHYFQQLVRITDRYPTPHDILTNPDFVVEKQLSHSLKNTLSELAANTVGVPGGNYSWLIKKLSLERNTYTHAQAEIAQVIHSHLESHSYTKILISFPCVGEITAATIIGIIQDVKKYSSKKKFRKALGFYAILTQSGSGKAYSHAGKGGNREGRKILFLVCIRCISPKSPTNDFKDYYVRQVALGKPKIKALMATAGKLAEILYHCLLNQELYHYTGIYKSPNAD